MELATGIPPIGPERPSRDRHGAAPHLADKALDASIDRQGYCVLRLLREDAALALGQSIEQCLDDRASPNQPGSNWYLGLLDPDRDRVQRTSALVRDHLLPALQDLFAVGRCHYASVAIKPAGAGPTPFHQHWASTVDPFARRISCWVLLSHSGEGPDTFRLVPGSQRLVPFIRHETSDDYFTSFSEVIDREFAVDLTLRPGQAVLFEESILHATGPNPTDRPRIAGIASFVGECMQTAVVRPDGDGHLGIYANSAHDPMKQFLETGSVPAEWVRLASAVDANQAIDESTFRTLLADRGFGPLSPDSTPGLDAAAPVPPTRGARTQWQDKVRSLFRSRRP